MLMLPQKGKLYRVRYSVYGSTNCLYCNPAYDVIVKEGDILLYVGIFRRPCKGHPDMWHCFLHKDRTVAIVNVDAGLISDSKLWHRLLEEAKQNDSR